MNLRQPSRNEQPRRTAGRRVGVWLIALLLLCVTPIAAVLTWQLVHELRANQAELEQDLSRSALSLSQNIERELSSSFAALTVLSQSELFQQGRIAALGRLLHGKPRQDWDSIFVMAPDGQVVLDTAVPKPPPDALQPLRELHARVMRQPGPTVWGGTGPSRRGVAIALPIMQGQSVRHVLGVRLSDELWQRLVTGASVPEQGRAELFDVQGRLLGVSGAVAVPSGATLSQEVKGDVASASPGVERSFDLTGQEVYAASLRLPTAQWIVRVSVPAAPVDTARRHAIVGALVTRGGSLLLGLLLAGLVAYRIARQVRATRADDEGGVRHEVRNSLNAVLTAAEVLEVAPPGSASAEEARAIIARQSRHLAHVLGGAPREPLETSEAPWSRESSDRPLPPSHRRQVLVVDDDADMLAVLREKLERDGHTVTTAADGDEGLSRLLQLKPEVSIVDIGLPGRTGYELARHARAAGYAGRMIAIAPDSPQHHDREARVAGFDACIASPVDGQQLRATIEDDG